MANKNFEIIEQDLNGELSKQESDLVKHKIKTDPQFANDYKLQQEVNKAISETEIIALRENMQNIFEKKSKAKKGIFKEIPAYNSFIKPSIAAAITVVLIISGFLIFNTNKDYTNNELFVNNFESIPSLSNTRSLQSNNNSDVLMKNAFELYEEQKYSEAIKIFKKFESNRLTEFYLGLSYIEISQYQNASVALSGILNDENNIFTEDTRWYLGLCYLKLDETQKAKELFTKLINSNSIYKQKAKNILKSL